MKKILFLLFISISVLLEAKEVTLTFNDPSDFYKDYRFSDGIEGSALDISQAAYHRNPVTVAQIDSVDMSGSF